MSGEFADTMSHLLERRPFGAGDARAAFEAILSGAWTPVQIAGFAVALRMHGETPDIIAGAAGAMRAAMAVVEHDLPLVVDTCGTGGDGSHTLNISTAAAVVVAASGLPVAKHGNRSASSRCGSADVFEALGIPLDVPVERQGDILREVGIAFLYAQAHHPTLKHAGQTRRELGLRTIFNVLGPISNPARATHQLVGVYEDALRPVLADALGRLGAKRAWVVHSEDGLDEVSPCAATRVSELTTRGDVRDFVITPEGFGIARIPRAQIAGADVDGNARALRAILDGQAHPARDAVVLNAAAAIAIATDDDLRGSADRARRAIDGGAARDLLRRWRDAALRARESAEVSARAT